MSKKAALLFALLLVGIAGCYDTAKRSSERESKPKSSNGREDSWFDLKPVSKMQPFEGHWEGETFRQVIFDSSGKLKSGADIRAELHEKNRLSNEERRDTETWYKLKLSIERKDLQLGETAPYSASMIIETHRPNKPVAQSEKSYMIRISGKNAIELRSTSELQAEYHVQPGEHDEKTRALELRSLNSNFGRVTLENIQNESTTSEPD